MKLLISPHNDDAALFAAFTLLKEKPLVVTVFDSFLQPSRGFSECSFLARREEDQAAMQHLGCSVKFCGVSDALSHTDTLDHVGQALLLLAKYPWTSVWIPASEQDGHEQHNIVSTLCELVFTGRIAGRYYTYTRTGGKTTLGTKVEYNGSMAKAKLQALLCYDTQLTIDGLGCYPHFIRNLEEYMDISTGTRKQ